MNAGRLQPGFLVVRFLVVRSLPMSVLFAVDVDQIRV